MYASDEQKASSAFKEAEKRYQRHIDQRHRASGKGRRSKARQLDTDLSCIIDFETPSTFNQHVNKSQTTEGQDVYILTGSPGFCFIPSALTVREQQHLAVDCFVAFPESPSHTNHTKAYGELPALWEAAKANWHLRRPTNTAIESALSGGHGRRASASSSVSQNGADEARPESGPATMRIGVVDRESCDSCSGIAASNAALCSDVWTGANEGPPAERLLDKLRWACVGPNFDWSNRRYLHGEPHQPMPSDLVELAQRCIKEACEASPGVELSDAKFRPDAALINYYKSGDTLGGHLDDVERDMGKPIVSFSLGCDAIFLLGGTSKSVPPTAILVRSGDAIILAGASRRCYHGVPRVLGERGPAKAFANISAASKEQAEVFRHMQGRRVNISVRETL